MGNMLQILRPKATQCEICIEPFSSSKKQFRNKRLCTHSFCVDCVIRYIEVKLQQNVVPIPCPALHCKKMLDLNSLQPMLTPTLFNKWSELLCHHTLSVVERCYCPYENCSVLVINECGGRARKSECPNCKRWFCFECKRKWHVGFPCQEEVRNDIAFGELAALKKWKRCPHCRHFVERNEGCNAIKCRCNTMFCYLCGKRTRECCGC